MSAADFEDILTALCSHVTPISSNASQKAFAIADGKEARLAFDVLVAHGFEAKVYDDSGTAKLYITLPAAEAAVTGQKLDAAMAYAKSLKIIKQSLDMLREDNAAQSSDYSLTLANTAAGGKQILVQLTPPSPFVLANKPASAPAAPVRQPDHAKPAAPKKSKMYHGPVADPFSSGPAVARKFVPAYLTGGKSQNSDGFGRQISLYITGNMATYLAYFLSILTILLVLYSAFVASEAFLCPDFATTTKKNLKRWYCPHPPKQTQENTQQQQKNNEDQDDNNQ